MAAAHPPLPIDEVLPQILAARDDRGAAREVLILQPRRLAARMSAQRVAESVGEAVGGRVTCSPLSAIDNGCCPSRGRWPSASATTRRCSPSSPGRDDGLEDAERGLPDKLAESAQAP